MSYTNIIKDIYDLPHYKKQKCVKCKHIQEVYTLDIYYNCEKCGTRMKRRGFVSIGSEIEDVIDAVLFWIGKENEFEDAMKRKDTIDSFKE